MLTVFGDALGIPFSQILSFIGVGRKVEEPGVAGLQFVNHLPLCITQAKKPKRIIGSEQGHLILIIEKRPALIFGGARKAEQVQNRRARIDKTGDPSHANGLMEQAGSRKNQWDADIFIIDKERMAVVSRMLAESFAMIAEQNEQRVVQKISLAQAVQQLAKSGVGFMEGVAIAIDLRFFRKRPR